MCRVKCRKHEQCVCECRPLHFHRNSQALPSHPPNQTVNVLSAVFHRQIHARWSWDSYVYQSDTPYGEYGGKLMLITAPRSYRERPITALDIPVDILLPLVHQEHNVNDWDITSEVENLNI